MKEADLRRIDLGLLVTFAETMRLRKLTLVAERLGQTQSTVSHALARLRDIVGDPLFLRRPHGVEPTARARALLPVVNDILDLARAALGPAAPFDPASTRRTLRIAAPDYHCSLFAGGLVGVCRAVAPGIVLSFLPLERRRALAALEADEADLVIGYFPTSDPRIHAEALFQQDYAVVVRREHPQLAALGSIEGFAAAEHLLVSQSGDQRGIVDVRLAEHGCERQVVATLPYFLAALATVAQTDLVLTIPRSLAKAHSDQFRLVLLDPPFAIRAFTVSAVRHARSDGDGAIDWAIARLRELTAANGALSSRAPSATPRAT